MRYLNVVLALLFALFALVQLNDPDPVLWVLAYGAVCVCCVLEVIGRRYVRALIVLAVILAGWMLTLLPGFIDWIGMGTPTITGSMKAEEAHIEVVREFLGLLIALLTVLHLLRLSIRARRA